MNDTNISMTRQVLVDRDGAPGMVTTSWGEQARIRLAASPALPLTILDFAAPPDFGPPRHIHRDEDEILLLTQGRAVFWSPEGCIDAGPGDLIVLPRGAPHTWRAYGDEPVRMLVIATAGRMESFFHDIVAQNLSPDSFQALTITADKAGMDIVGPPLSDHEVACIRDTGNVCQTKWNRHGVGA